MSTPPVTTMLLPVSQIHPNPDQPRKFFDPQAIADLKASIEQRGLINPISVVQKGEGDYVVIAGERRLRAVIELGWKEIDARIWSQGTSPQEIELLSLVENLQRKDLNPFEIAHGYKILTEAPHNLTQQQIANQIGKTQQAVALYLGLSELDPRLQQNTNRFVNLGLAHLIQICRLKTPDAQIAVAQDAAQKELSVRELKKLVDNLLKGDRPTSERKGPLVILPPKDPVADLWNDLQRDGNFPQEFAWEAKYGFHKIGPQETYKGWFFFAGSPEGPSKAELIEWFKQVLHALETGKVEKVVSQVTLDAIAAKEQMRKVIESAKQTLASSKVDPQFTMRAAQFWLPKTAEEAEDMEKSNADMYLPQSPKEWSEIEDCAHNGPFGVYSWTHGPQSYWARKARAVTWKDLGISDPVVGCHQIIEALKQGQKLREEGEMGPSTPEEKPGFFAKVGSLLKSLDVETRD